MRQSIARVPTWYPYVFFVFLFNDYSSTSTGTPVALATLESLSHLVLSFI